MIFKQCPDCVNYESNYCNNNNSTLTDQQAVISSLQHPYFLPAPRSSVCLFMCADSWHFNGVVLMRVVWGQLEKTKCFWCTALTGVINLHFFLSAISQCLPHFGSSSIFTFLSKYLLPPSLFCLLTFCAFSSSSFSLSILLSLILCAIKTVEVLCLIMLTVSLCFCFCPALQDFLETLEDLDLSYNNLVDIPWETIALLVSVNTLSLDHNLIESVPEGIFSNLHKLARSGSCDNSISTMCGFCGTKEGRNSWKTRGICMHLL